MVFGGGKGEVPEEILIAELCERYGWTYEEYLNAPDWLIETIKLKFSIEAEYQKSEMDKTKHTYGSNAS